MIVKMYVVVYGCVQYSVSQIVDIDLKDDH
jgi:hypothetical protein